MGKPGLNPEESNNPEVKKDENIIFVTAKENILTDDNIFIKAGERKGLSKEQVKSIMGSRNLAGLVEVEK